MERSFVSVLTLVTLVTATPHGYGVKGGASAKAEASAVAGAFGNLGPIPLSIPSGSAYSGSFSKSSSSSFASSSASSSSSSSSYSFSGSGANGIAGIGNEKGCSSGTCPGVGADGSSLNGGQQFTGANAVSAAQAKALSGSYSPCQGSNCNGSPEEKCTSGQCLTDSALNGQNGCTGNCELKSPSSGNDLTNNGSSDKGEKEQAERNLGDSNDFAVNINRNPQSTQLHGSNAQYSNKEKSHNAETGCSNGKCAPSNSDYSGLDGNHNHQPVPSTYLTTPKENPPCTTPNCNYPSQSNAPHSGGLPSSYNVPIQSATNPPNTYYSSPSDYGKKSTGVNPVAPCTSPNCNSTPLNAGPSNIHNPHFGQQGSGNHSPCASGQCDIPSTLNGKPLNNGVESGHNLPNYSHGSVPSNIPSGPLGHPGCTTPYCTGLPTYSNLPSNQQGGGCSGAACGGTPLTGSSIKPLDAHAPVYTGGFGGPAGFLEKTPGSNKLPGNSPYNNGHNTPSGNGPTFGSTPIQGTFGLTSPTNLNSNNHYGSTQTSSNGESSGVFEYNKPGSISTPGSQFNPSNTGSYAAPTTGHTGNNHDYSGGIGSSTGLSHTNSGSNSNHRSLGVTKPNTPSSSQNSPAYTGSFGGPTGGSSLLLGSLNKPGSGNCGSTVCNSQPGVSGGTPSYDSTNPSTSVSGQNKPTYTGGFGGPTGLLNPNNLNVPSNTPTVTSGNIPCTNGNCSPKGAPATSQESSPTSAHSVAAATASANAAVYSGGFGGPPGVLKPYDDGKVNIPVHGNLPSGHSLSSNSGNPKTTTDYGKNSESGGSVSGAKAAAHATAVASATAGNYGENNQNNNGASRGCNSGCSSNGAGDGNLGFPDGLTKNGLGVGSVASAKSSAGANAYGGNFASSSASAHASAGAATKGGYGRK